MNYLVKLIENSERGLNIDLVVTEKRLDQLEALKYTGGFLRFDIEVWDETNKKPSPRAKFDNYMKKLC